MITEPEHEIIPAIRDWLAATSDVEIPCGLVREEARRRAHDLLGAIAAGSVVPEYLDVDDESKDILWASVEELDGKPVSQQTFEECDCFYQFVLALQVKNDVFKERDGILRCVARIGWRSAPCGLKAVLKARATIWEHGDEGRHHEVCKTADQLGARIEALKAWTVPDVPAIREICARLLKLNNIRPSLVAQLVPAMEAFLSSDHRIGSLDDREHLKATVALITGIAGRQLARWDLAESGYFRAEMSFRRTVEAHDLDRVEVERLAVRCVCRDYRGVAELAPAMIKSLRIAREKLKAQIILADAMINLDRPLEARLLLEAAERSAAIEPEPILKVHVLTKLGNALSNLGRDADATVKLALAGEMLHRFHCPMMLAGLMATLAEHFAKLGNLTDSLSLFGKACDASREIGQLNQVAYLSVLRAEVLILLSKNEEAEAELLAALPLIEKFDLRREAVAAVALLRESMAKRRTDVKTIQQLRHQLRKELP